MLLLDPTTVKKRAEELWIRNGVAKVISHQARSNLKQVQVDTETERLSLKTDLNQQRERLGDVIKGQFGKQIAKQLISTEKKIMS